MDIKHTTIIMWKDVQYILSIKIQKQRKGSVAKWEKNICMDQVSVVWVSSQKLTFFPVGQEEIDGGETEKSIHYWKLTNQGWERMDRELK